MKRKKYQKSDKWNEAVKNRTNWSKRAEIYSLKYDQGKSTREIAKIYDLSTQRINDILKECQITMKPE